MVSYAENYIKAYGTPCKILRDTPTQTFVSMKAIARSTTDLAARESYFEGLIPADANLISGDIIEIGTNDYIIESVMDDFAFGEKVFYAVKSNMILGLKKPIKSVDANKNIVINWLSANSNIIAYVEVANYRLRQTTVGLLDQTLYIAQLPKTYPVDLLDRIIFSSDNSKYQIDSIDNIGLKGVVRIQLSEDKRETNNTILPMSDYGTSDIELFVDNGLE